MKADIILIDVPWSFRVWSRETGNGRSASSHYETQDLETTWAYPVGQLAADNCALFMWCVWPRIFDAKMLFDAWGFEYKTLAWEWLKLNKLWRRLFTPIMPMVDEGWLERLFFFGMGYYFRANVEPCLLAVRGRMPISTRSERNILIAPIRGHSQKPDEQYAKIERAYPASKYPNRVELFARQAWPGWVALGNEIDGQDLNVSIRRLIEDG